MVTLHSHTRREQTKSNYTLHTATL